MIKPLAKCGPQAPFGPQDAAVRFAVILLVALFAGILYWSWQ